MHWLLSQAGELLVDCSTEPVDRIETRPFVLNVTATVNSRMEQQKMHVITINTRSSTTQFEIETKLNFEDR